MVIPGHGEAVSPESIFQRPVLMDSGLAVARRPGMTRETLAGAKTKRHAAGSNRAQLSLAWPVDLGLTVASHGWVHLEPWVWEPETGTLSHAERIGGQIGRIAMRQRDPTRLPITEA